MWINIILGIVTIGYLLYWYVTRTFNHWKNRNVIGPKPVPLFGNLKESALRRKVFHEVMKDIYSKYPDEKVVGIFTMTTPCLLLRDLDVIKHVMIKDFDNFSDRGVEISEEGLGANLFHMESESWQVLRNKFTPLFTSGKLKNMMHLITDRGDNFVDHIRTLCKSNNEQEIYHILCRYTMSTISACAFGVDIESDKQRLEDLYKINDLIFQVRFVNELDLMFPGVLKKWNISLFPKILNSFFNNLVETVFAQRNSVPGSRKDFMDLLLAMKQQKVITGVQKSDKEATNVELTDSLIAAQAFIFYAAGTETSSSTMTFTLYQLALNPDIQDKLIEEIDTVLAESEGKLTYEKVMEMKYLAQVFDETLRMYPIVDPLQRKAKADYKIPGTNYEVKKGEVVYVSVLGIQNDEKYYPEPSKFDPERFSNENLRNKDSNAYMPFGTGPRNCIGMRFAKLQSRIAMVKFLSNFRVEPSKKTPKVVKYDPYRPVLGHIGGMYLNIVPRTDNRK